MQRESELQEAVGRISALQTWLNRFKNICTRHRDQLIFGTSHVPADWWDGALAGGEQDSVFSSQAAGDGVPSVADKCVLCDVERLNDVEVQNVRLVAENESMRKWTQEADDLVYRMEQRIAHREGRLPDPRMTTSGSFLDRLRVFDASVARLSADYDRGVETRQQLERQVAEHKHSIALLDQRLRDSLAGAISIDATYRDRVAADANELQNTQATITMLEQALQQKSAELEQAAVQYDRLRNEAKLRIRELKSQLETQQAEYRSLSDAESKLHRELMQVTDELETERTSAGQYKETAQQQLEDNRKLVSVAAAVPLPLLFLWGGHLCSHPALRLSSLWPNGHPHSPVQPKVK